MATFDVAPILKIGVWCAYNVNSGKFSLGLSVGGGLGISYSNQGTGPPP